MRAPTPPAQTRFCQADYVPGKLLRAAPVERKIAAGAAARPGSSELVAECRAGLPRVHRGEVVAGRRQRRVLEHQVLIRGGAEGAAQIDDETGHPVCEASDRKSV